MTNIAQNIDIDIELITPEKARFYLNKNGMNRSVSSTTVSGYADDIRDDRWELTGDPIKFDQGGNLIDGQHRLAAIILADKAIPLTVARGLSPSSFQVLDAGKKRNAADVLHSVGVSNATTVASSVRLLYTLEMNGASLDSPRGTTNLKPYQVKDILEDRYPFLERAASLTRKYSTANKLLTPSAATVLFHFFNQKDIALCEKFFNSMNTGADLHAGTPFLRLRELLLSSRQDPMKIFRAYHGFCYAVNAWNYERHNVRQKKYYLEKDVKVTDIK